MRKKYGALLTIIVLAGGLVAQAIVTNHSSSSSSSRSSSSTRLTTSALGQPEISYNMQPSNVPTSCTIVLRGHDAQVTFSSDSLDVTPACTSWIQIAATKGDLWSQVPIQVAPSSPSMETICSLSLSGRASAIVDDDGGELYGQQACTQLLSTGVWTQGPTPTSPTTASTPPPTPPPCPRGFARTDYGGDCIDERHLPCPAGYSGYQNSQVDNCLENESP